MGRIGDYIFSPMGEGTKVKVSTVGEGMVGTIVGIDYIDDQEIAEVRLENGYLLQRIRPFEVELCPE